MLKSRNAAAYVRQSKGDAEGIERQIERTTALIAGRGWTLAGVYIDNDVSASKVRGKGTDWARLLNDATVGDIDTVVSVDLDRLLRTTRDLNTLIDHGLMAVTVDGELDLSTADGEFRATMLAGIARFEVRRKGERQQRANAQRREKGEFRGQGWRLYGYTRAGELVPAEADILRSVFARFIAGESLRSIHLDLIACGVVGMNGKPLSRSTLNRWLTNPRYAGRQTFDGKATGQLGSWTPLVTEAEFDTVAGILSDPRRLTRRVGTARAHVGSGVYLCECGETVRTTGGRDRGSGQGRFAYVCPNLCYSRSGVPIDAHVEGVVAAWIEQLDPVELQPQIESDDAAGALAAIRERIRRTQEDYDNDLIDGQRYHAKTARLEAELEAAEKAQAKSRATSALSSLDSSLPPAEAFASAPVGIRAQIIREFFTVTLARPYKGQGSKAYDRSTVKIERRKALLN
jgi:DNA invertase Pin-like site-specific DNA recombinase